VAIISVGVNVVISLATVERLGLQGLALGIAVGAWFEAITLTILLHRRHHSITARPVVSGGLVSLVGALIAAFVAAGFLAFDGPIAGSGFIALLLQLTVATLAAGLVYLLYSRLVRLPELPRTIDLLRSARRSG
jgi:peptidoglycan biosynthesis protein MviN/MurJ (putative lipid II flippase)